MFRVTLSPLTTRFGHDAELSLAHHRRNPGPERRVLCGCGAPEVDADAVILGPMDSASLLDDPKEEALCGGRDVHTPSTQNRAFASKLVRADTTAIVCEMCGETW